MNLYTEDKYNPEIAFLQRKILEFYQIVVILL